MKNFLLILACFIINKTHSQNYNNYNNGILEAKKAIINNDFELASKFYFETFESYEFVFARDCYNALEISCKIKNQEKIYYFFSRCLKQGIEFDYLNSLDILKDFKNSDLWNLILKEKNNYHLIYKKSINWNIREEIIQMFNKDQEIRDLSYKNRWNIFKVKKWNKKWKELNKNQAKRIIEITQNIGFPGEKLIGIDTYEMHKKIKSNNFSSSMPIIILIHYYSEPNTSFNDILFNQIDKGNINNEHYAVICDFQNEYSDKKIQNYTNRFSTNNASLDLRRLQIGLISIEELNKLETQKTITPFWKRLY